MAAAGTVLLSTQFNFSILFCKLQSRLIKIYKDILSISGTILTHFTPLLYYKLE